MNKSRKNLLIGAGGLLLGYCVKEGLRGAWRYIQEEEPPDQPDQQKFAGAQVLAWTVATAAVSGLVKGLYTRYVQKNDLLDSHFSNPD